MHARCGLLFLLCAVFAGFNLLSEELLRVDDNTPERGFGLSGRKPSHSAEMFQGIYTVRVNNTVIHTGSLRAALGSYHANGLGMQLSSISVLLAGMVSLGKPDGALDPQDAEFTLRGMEVTGTHRMTATGISDPNSFPAMKTELCHLDATLNFNDVPGTLHGNQPGTANDAVASAKLGNHGKKFVGEVVSMDCGFFVSLTAEAVDLQHIGRKVIWYAIWVNILTFIQMRCFLSQMRSTDEGPSAAKQSLIGIALQALMDAYDSFLHLSLSASSPYMFNTFAVISLFKFVLFALLEVRYLLTIWRQRHREIFAEGWDAVRRELSRVYFYFYGALIGGLILIFHSLDHLDVIAVAFQAYWVPQILHDMRHGSKNGLTMDFLIGISVTRSLAVLYLWGCPSNVFNGELFPQLPHAPNIRLCIAALLFQVAQVGIMVSQKFWGPRWFVPNLCMPHVYNYRRGAAEVPPGTECVICMGEITPEDGHQRVTTPCEHRFHRICLERWMDIKMECPTCRTALPPMG